MTKAVNDRGQQAIKARRNSVANLKFFLEYTSGWEDDPRPIEIQYQQWHEQQSADWRESE